MSIKKKLLIALLALVLLGAVAAGLCWNFQHYVLAEGKFYPRAAKQLDLRGEEVTVKEYDRLQRRLPGCEILWSVPFQDRLISSDTQEITVQTLSEQDVRMLSYFPMLKTLNADGCTDYENLLKVSKSSSEIRVEYTVQMGGEKYSGNVKQISLETVTDADVANLPYLPQLQKVLCGGGGTAENIAQLKKYCQSRGVEFLVTLGEEIVPLDVKEVSAEAVTDEQLDMLAFLPELTELQIVNPEASAEELIAAQEEFPQVELTWEQELYGTVYPSDLKELDLSGTTINSLEELEQEMAYFPEVETVFLGECGLDNEELAQLREQVRDQYKLVWVVTCGNKLKTRTDAKTFMPVREHVYYFNDQEAYNLRYCEEMVCIDIGHMSIHNIDFVEFMPDLQYLILAHTQLNYIEPIRHCKKLKFLELDWSPLRDLTPLKECTALEDLNLGNTFADFTPIGEMTWLKNLWMVDCSTSARYQMTQALPDTKVMISGSGTVANGWRNLENYYAMRDLLGMYYMTW